MKLELLDTKEQFIELKKGDLIIVRWDDFFVKHHPKTENIMPYRIYENKQSHEEIICQLKGNHFFNYEMYLKKISSALEVYKVKSNNE